MAILVCCIFGLAYVIFEHIFFASNLIAIILVFIKSYYLRHIQVLKYVYVASCSVTVSVDAISCVNWTHEGHELAGDDPV